MPNLKNIKKYNLEVNFLTMIQTQQPYKWQHIWPQENFNTIISYKILCEQSQYFEKTPVLYSILLRARFHIPTHQWVDNPAGKWRKHTQKRKHIGITVLSTVKASTDTLLWECNLVTSLCKTTWQLFIKINVHTLTQLSYFLEFITGK